MSNEKINVNEIQLNGIDYVRKDSISNNQMAQSNEGMKYVLIRSIASGVFFGYLKSEKFTDSGKVVVLKHGRRVYQWYGAATLSQLAIDGTSRPNDCKFPEALSEIEIVNVIETIELTEKAKNSLNSVKIWKV